MNGGFNDTMNDDRQHARAAGVLFIIATVAGVVFANAVGGSALRAPIDVARLAADPTPVYLWALINLVGFIACPAIALALYPVLRRYGEGLALGSVVFRSLEAVFYLLGLVAMLLLVSVGNEAAASGTADPVDLARWATLLGAARTWLGFVVAVVCFGTGALLYGLLLYRSRLVPRWLSGWGIAGAALTAASAVLVLVGITEPVSPLHMALNLPTFAQEMVLAVWLIAKGFSPRALAAVTPVPASAPAVAGALS
jgi:hypothetical protein